MKKIILITIILLMIAAPVFAQSFHHELTVELDGEWDLNSLFDVQGSEDNTGFSSGFTLRGIGKARIYSITKANFTPSWWDLF